MSNGEDMKRLGNTYFPRFFEFVLLESNNETC